MNDVLRALAISAGILFLVVILTVFISIAAVRRGEAAMRGASHEVPGDSHPVPDTVAPPPVKAAKPAAPAAEEISVAQILLYGVGLFTLTILLLLGMSLVQHLG